MTISLKCSKIGDCFGIGMSRKLKTAVASVSLSTLSYHNNKGNYEVFSPVLNELISKVLNTGSVNESLKRFVSIRLIDSTISTSLNFKGRSPR